ncbi:MAG: hypothetical protein KJN63_04775, partial [Acidimicrobiia bacterium]|nr:hypothetical protein [Acidimicrobiia bacterium]
MMARVLYRASARTRRAATLAIALATAVAVVLPVAAPSEAAVSETKLTASDAAPDDLFGWSVGLSGDTAVVGGLFLSTPEGAYVFGREGDGWVEQAQLTASDAAPDDSFGSAVAIDGSSVIVGAAADDDGGQDSGSAYVFVLDGDTWVEQAKLTASDPAAGDLFGESVAISGDTAVVGAICDDDSGSCSGSAYVFTRSGSSWTQQAKLVAADGAVEDYFGVAVAVSADTVIVGADLDDDAGDGSGSAYVFTRSGSVWSQQAKLTASDAAASDFFGGAVAISGDTAVVGAQLDDDGGDLSGSAYVFGRSGSVWSQQEKLTASDAAANSRFGRSVSISGATIGVGAFGQDSNTGAAYVFTLLGDSWVERSKLTASDGAVDDQFGFAVAVSGDTAIAGAGRDDDGGADAGAAYVFDLNLRPYEPSLVVFVDGQVVEGHGWLVDSEVWMVVDDPSTGPGADLTVNAFVEPAPWDPENASLVEFWFDEHDLELQPGFNVSITDFITTKSLWVSDLMITGVDPVAETVSGVASPWATVRVEIETDVMTDVWENLAFQLSPGRFDRNPDSWNEHLEFRQAVAHAIDRGALRDAADPGGEVIFSYLTEGNGGLVGDGWAQYPYDPVAASALIDGLCLDLVRDCGTGSGWTQPPVAVFTTTDSPHRQAIADELQLMLNAVGIEMTVVLEPASQYFEDTLPNRTFDMGEWAWGLDLQGLAGLALQHQHFDPDEAFQPNPYGWGVSGSAVVNAGTVRMADLVQLMQSETDPSAMEALIFEAEQILSDQVVFIPLYVRSEGAPLGFPNVEAIADASGNWTADFSFLYDLEPQVQVVAIEEDSDGDSTHARYRLPGDPEFGVTATHDWIEFFDFAGETITFTFDDDDDVGNGVLYEETISLEPYAYNYHHLLDWFDIEVGQYVTVTDGFVTKTHQVLGVAVTDVDVDNWVMYGTTDPDITIDTFGIHPEFNVFGLHDVAVDETGNWQLDLDTVIDPNDRPAQIPEGAVFGAGQRDDDSDRTVTFWDPANVEGRVLADGVPVAGAEVWYPYGFGTQYGCTDADGYFSIPVSVVRHLVQGLLGTEHFFASGRAVSTDAACSNPGFVGGLGVPLLTVFETATIDVQRAINHVELHTGPAAAYQTVHVGDSPPDFDPLDYALVHVFDRSDLDFVAEFGTDVSAMDFGQVFWSGTGRIAGDLTSAYLADDPGTLELRYAAVTDVLVLAQLADGSIVGDTTDSGEFAANAVAAHGPSLYFPNRPPEISMVYGPVYWVVDEDLTAYVDVTDLNIHDTHSAVFDWGDGASSDSAVADGFGSATHQYSEPGVYVVEVTVTDSAGWSDVGSYEIFVTAFEYTESALFSAVEGDVSGDGLSDVVHFDADTGVWVAVSDGSSFGFEWWSGLPVVGGSWVEFVSGDFSGDGVSDVAGYEVTSGKWFVFVSTG